MSRVSIIRTDERIVEADLLANDELLCPECQYDMRSNATAASIAGISDRYRTVSAVVARELLADEA